MPAPRALQERPTDRGSARRETGAASTMSRPGSSSVAAQMSASDDRSSAAIGVDERARAVDRPAPSPEWNEAASLCVSRPSGRASGARSRQFAAPHPPSRAHALRALPSPRRPGRLDRPNCERTDHAREPGIPSQGLADGVARRARPLRRNSRRRPRPRRTPPSHSLDPRPFRQAPDCSRVLRRCSAALRRLRAQSCQLIRACVYPLRRSGGREWPPAPVGGIGGAAIQLRRRAHAEAQRRLSDIDRRRLPAGVDRAADERHRWAGDRHTRQVCDRRERRLVKTRRTPERTVRLTPTKDARALGCPTCAEEDRP